MRRRPTNIDGLCDALNAMGIRATVLGAAAVAKPHEEQTSRSVEDAHRRSVKEIARIAGNAKRLTSKK